MKGSKTKYCPAEMLKHLIINFWKHYIIPINCNALLQFVHSLTFSKYSLLDFPQVGFDHFIEFIHFFAVSFLVVYYYSSSISIWLMNSHFFSTQQPFSSLTHGSKLTNILYYTHKLFLKTFFKLNAGRSVVNFRSVIKTIEVK